MQLLHVVVLLCAVSVDSDHCNRDTAVDVLQREHNVSPLQCMFLGQAGIAASALAPRDGYHVKVLCVRERD